MKRELLNLSIRLIIIVLVVLTCTKWIFGIFIYHGQNMSPWMRDGDLVIVYRLADYTAGTVAAYEKDGDIKFGRICGVENDEIEITEEKYLVNGSAQVENVFFDTIPAEQGITYPYTVPENAYFLMNDMRTDTNDSRQTGAVERERMQGSVIFTMSRRGF